MPFDLFVLKLFDPGQRFLFLAWVVAVIISITLHELAHGFMGIRCGDDTPIRMNRMTLNPLVHMGPFSLIALLVVGIAWGAMPIDPTRLKGKYAEAKVAFAGPSLNLSLALLCLAGYGLMLRFGLGITDDTPLWQQNALRLLMYAGSVNLILFVFNMLPAPPLDGSVAITDLGVVQNRVRRDVPVASEASWYSMDNTIF